MLLTSQALKDRHHTAHVNYITVTEEISTKDRVNVINSSGGAIVITLPPVVAARGLMFCFLLETAGNKVEFVDNGNDSIDPTAFEAIDLDTQYDKLVMMSDGITWYIMSSARDET